VRGITTQCLGNTFLSLQSPPPCFVCWRLLLMQARLTAIASSWPAFLSQAGFRGEADIEPAKGGMSIGSARLCHIPFEARSSYSQGRSALFLFSKDPEV